MARMVADGYSNMKAAARRRLAGRLAVLPFLAGLTLAVAAPAAAEEQQAVMAANRVLVEVDRAQLMRLDQPASAIIGIKALVGLVPGAALLLGALILVWFPLRGERLKAVQEAVLALHAEKQASLHASGLAKQRRAHEPPSH